MTKAANGDHNISDLKREIVVGVNTITSMKEDRKHCNDAIAAVKAKLETRGIKKEALVAAVNYMGWDEDKRAGFDLAYDICREALGQPFKAQGELIDWAEQKAKKKAEKAAAKKQEADGE